MEFSLLTIIPSVIIFQLLLLVLFLFTSRKGKPSSNRILGLFFLWLLLNLADALLSFTGFYEQHPAWAHLEDGLILAVGPLIYFYTRSMVYKDFHLSAAHAVHLFPFVLLTAVFQTYYHLQTTDYQKMIQSAIAQQDLPVTFYVFTSLLYVHLAVYLLFSFREVMGYRHRIRSLFSSLDKINLDWLVFMLACISGMILISIIYTFLPVTGLRTFFENSLLLPFLFIFVFTNAVVWKGLRQPEIFAGIESTPEKEDKRYASSSLSSAETEQILSRLNHLFQADKVFLEPDLTLEQLAEKAGTYSRKLSQVIHTAHQQNFFDFVNSARIEEARNIFTNSKDAGLTVLEVMYACGFNSKSSFNSTFRKKTGLTPSAFRKAALQRN